MTTWITVCDTCKRDDWDGETETQTHGEQLAKKIEAAAAGKVKTRRVSCLMGCKHSCNIAVQAEGKLTYTLGAFEPTDEAAEAIVEYATLHEASQTGQVPFKQWPQPIKGHFITRIPPLSQE